MREDASVSQQQAIRAAGVVLIRHGASPQVAVIHRPHRADWTLPKGKVDPGEVLPQTAVREVLEETRLHVTLGMPLTTQEYPVNGAPKTVHYWRASGITGEFAPTDEVDELRWLDPDEAKRLLTYDHDHRLVDEALTAPTTVPLLLVRHAHAGDGATWRAAGRDDLVRPLSEKGQKAVPLVTALARAYGVDSVVTSPALRCTQTVAGVREFTRWSENPWIRDGADIDSPGFAEFLEHALHATTPLAVCAHGEQLDWLVDHLGVGPLRFAKGGTLVLHRDATDLARIVASEWYPPSHF
ncbi:MAG: NUDIX hydrolase [Actinobacteria bacterium]|nr:NUDIX hydrolase [Actinomycetota bacterium]